MPKFDDDSIMPWGKEHKGKKFIDVPDSWFTWFWGENKSDFYTGRCYGTKLGIMEYIKDSFEDLP